MGACRHGDRCSRQHNKPLFSQTVLLNHMYQAPNSTTVQTGPTSMGTAADDVPAQEHFDDFFEEVPTPPWRQIDGLLSQLPYKCHQNRVASVED